MRSRRRLLFLFLFIAAVCLFAWFLLRPSPPEPSYQGRPLREWLECYAPGRGYARSNEIVASPTQADDAIQHIGTNAIPTLLRMLRARDSRFKREVAMFMVHGQDLVEFHYAPPETLNLRATLAFEALGATASNAAPEIIRIAAANLSPASYQAAARAFTAIGPAAAPCIPLLIHTATNTTDLWVRTFAAQALGDVHAQPELSVPVLIILLRDPNLPVKRSAIIALRAFGRDAKPAIPALAALLRDKNDDVDFHRTVERALLHIDPAAGARAIADYQASSPSK